MRVAGRLDTPKVRVVGWLHDTLEDTALALSEIEAQFGPETVATVDALSRKEGDAWSEYLDHVQTNPIARQVKISDLIENSNLGQILVITMKDVKRHAQYNKAMQKLMEV